MEDLMLIADRGMLRGIIEEIKNILNRNFDFELYKTKNKYFIILKNLNEKEIIKISYKCGTCDYILKILDKSNNIENLNLEKDFRYIGKKDYIEKNNIKINNESINFLINLKDKFYFCKNIVKKDPLYIRDYRRKKRKEIIKSTNIKKIIVYYGLNNYIVDLYGGSTSFSLEYGIYLKDIPIRYWIRDKLLLNKEYDPDLLNEILYGFQIKSIKKEMILYIGKNNKIMNYDKVDAINAMVKDIINFKYIDQEFLEFKIKENSYENIFLFLEKDDEYLNRLLIYNANHLLKNNGKIILLSFNKPYDLFERYKMKIEEENVIINRNKKLYLFILNKT